MSVRRSFVHLRALVGLALCTAPAIASEPQAAFPASWPDQTSSVYSQPAEPAEKYSEPPEALPAPVVPASFTAPVVEAPIAAEPIAAPPEGDRRRLAPRRRDANQTSADLTAESLPSFGLSFDSVYTTGTALAVVLGVFFLCAALVRRGAKRSNSRLPEEVVSVLGRVPLAARQVAELVRVGNKLVLISITPHGAEPLTEITDPAEIDRLVGLCHQGAKGSSTEEFDQIFRKLADESAPAGFLGDEAPRVESRLTPSADVFAAYRGARNA
jgi:flagellar biogenesis protein FliO